MANDSKLKKEEENPSEKKPPNSQPLQCACNQDPFAALPPEFRSRSRSWKDGFREVTCPGCGLHYWTSNTTDLCMECVKKGIKLPSPETKTGAE